ncbi:MAG: DUF1501 domain-containing protein [Planctomycetota bacterium]|nr:DUF1501 domain-containing protein [Planctomycetota bacterium]
MALQVDQPIAAWVKDLRRSGLLENTPLVWAGEFGRTPFSQGSHGRDHTPSGFSVWFCGGGVKSGVIDGAIDELGYHAAEDRCEVYHLWATVLHLLGMNHHKLTYCYAGRDLHLTDVQGNCCATSWHIGANWASATRDSLSLRLRFFSWTGLDFY